MFFLQQYTQLEIS